MGEVIDGALNVGGNIFEAGAAVGEAAYGVGAAVGAGALEFADDAWDYVKSPDPSEAETSATPVVPDQESTNSDNAQQSAKPTADIKLVVIGTPNPQLTKHQECDPPSVPNGDSAPDRVSNLRSSTYLTQQLCQ